MEGAKTNPDTYTDTNENTEFSSAGGEKAAFNKDADAVELEVPPGDPKESASSEYQCGVGPWRPAFLQRFADMRLLTLVLAVMSLLNGVVFAYYNAVITSIENRFGLPSSIMGFVKNVDNLGYVASIVFVSHFCRFVNKPRLFACTCVLSAFATALFGFPHFVYGSGDPLNAALPPDANSTETSTSKGLTQFCEEGQDNATDVCDQPGAENLLGTYNAGALGFFIASEFLQGVSNTPAISLGITYVDDNMGSNSPKYFGKQNQVVPNCTSRQENIGRVIRVVRGRSLPYLKTQ